MSNLSRRGLIGTLAGVSSLALLTACKEGPSAEPSPTPSGESTAPSPSDNSPQESTPQETTPQESSPQESTPAGGGGDEKTVRVDKVLNDQLLGDKVEILSAVRHASLPKAQADIANGAELVLLEVRFTPSERYGGTVAALNFELIGGDGQRVRGRSTYDDELTASGRKALGIASRRNGPATGWMGVLMRQSNTAETYEGVYTRRKARIIGQDKVLAEFTGRFSVSA